MVGTLRMQLRPRPEDIVKLKAPLGELLTGEPEEAIPKLLQLIEREKPPKIVTVGDVVSRETWKAGVRVDLRIVDRRSMRESLGPYSYQTAITYQVKNPAGVISMESWDAIRKAMKQEESLIIVDGEEDLLALPCIVESHDNALVLYGQPSEGMVVVKVSSRIRADVDRILQRARREEA